MFNLVFSNDASSNRLLFIRIMLLNEVMRIHLNHMQPQNWFTIVKGESKLATVYKTRINGGVQFNFAYEIWPVQCGE